MAAASRAFEEDRQDFARIRWEAYREAVGAAVVAFSTETDARRTAGTEEEAAVEAEAESLRLPVLVLVLTEDRKRERPLLGELPELSVLRLLEGESHPTVSAPDPEATMMTKRWTKRRRKKIAS